MLSKLNALLDRISEYLAPRKGLLIFIGIVFILVNLIIQFVAGSSWLSTTNLLLHAGIVVALIGIMLAWAL